MTDAVEVLRIDSLEDERLDAYVRLTERELRCVLEPQKGIFIAESAKVIERAVRAGYEPVSFLLGERWLDQMMPLFDQLVVREGAGPVPVFVASMELMEQLTGFNVTRGALAAFGIAMMHLSICSDGWTERQLPETLLYECEHFRIRWLCAENMPAYGKLVVFHALEHADPEWILKIHHECECSLRHLGPSF